MSSFLCLWKAKARRSDVRAIFSCRGCSLKGTDATYFNEDNKRALGSGGVAVAGCTGGGGPILPCFL